MVCAPILFALAYTVPDVRREGMANYWALSFLLSILWIGASSYLMVWWATVVGDVVRSPAPVHASLLVGLVSMFDCDATVQRA